MLTSEVAPVSAPSWLAVTSVVFAPEQAAKKRERKRNRSWKRKRSL